MPYDGRVIHATSSPLIRPDRHARIFLAGTPFASSGAPTDPMQLVAEPVAQCLSGLMDALHGGAEFCIHADAAGAARTGPGTPGMISAATSGTSSAPKRVRRSQASWVASFEVNAGLFDLTRQDRYAVLGGLHHSLALYALCEALHLGADVDVVSGQRPDRQWAQLAATTVLYATPAQVRLLCRVRPDRSSHAALRLLLVGGGALDAATRAEAARAFPHARIAVFYGASETSFITLDEATSPEGSVGRPYPGVTLDLCDSRGRPVSEGETGEIWVRSPYLFDGYAGAGSPDTRWRDGFLSVGELGRLDADGNLFIAGRLSRMFTVADRNVIPEEIEAELRALPGVIEAAVLPLPDARRGHVPVAFLTGEVDMAALHRMLRARLGPLIAPRRLHVLDAWPRLASGKTDLRALAALL